MKNSILFVEDDPDVRWGVKQFLEKSGYDVTDAKTVGEAERHLESKRPDLIVADFLLPDGDALRLLKTLRMNEATIPVIILTGNGSIELAVQCVKEGAEQFLTKPVNLNSLGVMIDRALERERQRKAGLVVRQREERAPFDPFTGSSPAIRKLRAEALAALEGESSILIQGETGTGKGVLAAWIHRNGKRAANAFVDLNCAGLQREFLESELFGHVKGAYTGAVNAKQGLLELAHRGTMFLDEIGDMDLQVQPKLLKVLEDRRFRRLGDVRETSVDVRFIFATHHNLAKQSTEGRFRSDFYFRINVHQLVLPPLRERAGDIPAIAAAVADGVARQIGRPSPRLTGDAVAAMQEYAWPGNIRELRNVLERALIRSDGDVISADSLGLNGAGAKAPPVLQVTGGPVPTLAELERQHITEVFAQTGQNAEESARLLGISRASMYNRLREYGLSPKRRS